MAAPPGDTLRLRAIELRNFAARLDRSGAHQLAMLAGPDTWIGPTPQRCHDDMERLRRTVAIGADDLRAIAAHLEVVAAELDAMRSSLDPR